MRTKPQLIGIDLGTSNTCAGYADGRIPRIIPTERGHNLLASVVAYVRGNCIVGQPAKDQMLMRPEETVYHSKRFVGRPFKSPTVQALKAHYAYAITPGPDGLCAADVGGKIRPLTEISAILLEQIKRYATAHLGKPLDGCVITVPAYYPLRQRDAIRDAATTAGLDVWRLVNEPTAAALAYGFGRHVDQRVLVFDLGGGTFDVSILQIADGTYQVLATGGDGFLGGADFDIRLTEYLLSRFQKDEGVDLREQPAVVQRVLNAAEAAKCDLSLLRHAEIRLPYVAEKRGKPLDMLLHISRQQLNELTADLVSRCLGYVKKALADANLAVEDIDEVLLAGGQTRMPLLQQKLADYFGKVPRKGLHPDEVVAQGAALLASSLGRSDDLCLLDVLSVPIGVAARAEKMEIPAFDVVLDKNIVLPHENHIDIETWSDGQTSMAIDIFQGKGPSLGQTEYLGTARVTGLPALTAGRVKVRFTLSLDVDGMLTVTAKRPKASPIEVPIRQRPPGYLLRLGSQEGAAISASTEGYGIIRRWFRRR